MVHVFSSFSFLWKGCLAGFILFCVNFSYLFFNYSYWYCQVFSFFPSCLFSFLFFFVAIVSTKSTFLWGSFKLMSVFVFLFLNADYFYQVYSSLASHSKCPWSQNSWVTLASVKGLSQLRWWNGWLSLPHRFGNWGLTVLMLLHLFILVIMIQDQGSSPGIFISSST